MLHGCLQFVLSNVRLDPQTNEIPTINLYLIVHIYPDKDDRIMGGLRQVLMALMFWAIDVPQILSQCDARINNRRGANHKKK